MIGSLSLIYLSVTALSCLFFPIFLSIVWIKKTQTSAKMLWLGAMMFLISVMLLENILHSFVLSHSFISNNSFITVIYSCLSAAAVEESGRYFVFHRIMKKKIDKKSAIAYGLGHGTIEMLMLVSLPLLSMLMLAWNVNQSTMTELIKNTDSASLSALQQILRSLQSFGWDDSFVILLERAGAMLMHIACSYLVYVSVHQKNRRYFAMALFFHFIVNIPATLIQKGLSIWIAESFLVTIITIGIVLVYNKYRKETE